MKSKVISLLFFLFIFQFYTENQLRAKSVGAEVNESDLKKTDGSKFDRLVRRLSYNPDDLETGDELRNHCRSENISTECIEKLNELTEQYPKNKFLRYQAALAYVDEIPGHSLFRQGLLSSRAMGHMTEVIDWEPNDWSAYYIRGLNGLYWPTLFRKLPRAIKDFQFCISLSNKLPKGLLKPYHIFAYIALGDAYVKDGDVIKGREVYRKGLGFFKSNELRNRIKMNPDELVKFVTELRHTDQRVDTEISFLLDGGADKL